MHRWPAWEGHQARQRVAGLCWPPAAPESRGPGGRAPPTAIAFLAIPLIYFERLRAPHLPALSLVGSRAALLRPPRLPPGLTPSPIPWCLCLQHLCCLATLLVLWGLLPEQRVPGSSAVPSSVCPSSGPTPSGKLQAALAKLPRGPVGSSCMNGWALRWPCGQAYVTGVAGGVAAGTAGAWPLSVASVEFVGSVLGWGGWLIVFLNK